MSLIDQLTEIVSLHTITASETSNTFVVVPEGALGNELTARVQYWNAQQASGSGVWTFTVQASYNRGSTWNTLATGAAITLSATAQNAEQALAFLLDTAPDSGEFWIQVLCTLTGSPTTPTIAYRADLVGGFFS